MMIHSTGDSRMRPSDAPVTSMTRLAKSWTPSTATNECRIGSALTAGESEVIAAPSSDVEFMEGIDGGDTVLIDADSPWDALPGSLRSEQTDVDPAATTRSQTEQVCG